MRRSGAEPEPKCGSKVHEASLQADEAVMKSPYETSLPRVGKLDVGRITSWLPNETSWMRLIRSGIEHS
jgi:hypothetical protein